MTARKFILHASSKNLVGFDEVRSSKPILTHHIGKKTGYKRHFSYYFKWLNLKTTLSQHENEKLKATLTEQQFVVEKNKRKVHFWLDDLIAIRIELKKLLFPLILGGISTPLSLVWLMRGDAQNWVALALLLFGGAFFYYGWQGEYQLEVETVRSRHAFFIGNVLSQKWENLIRNTNTQIMTYHTTKKVMQQPF